MIPPITNNVSNLLLDKEFSATVGVNDVVFDIQTGKIIHKGSRWQVLFNSPANVDNEHFQELIEIGVLSSYEDLLEYFELLKEPVHLAEHRQVNGLYYDEATGYLFEVKKGHVNKILSGKGEEVTTISFSYNRNDPFFVQKIYISENPIKIDIVLSQEDSSVTNINIFYQFLAQDLKVLSCRIKIY